MPRAIATHRSIMTSMFPCNSRFSSDSKQEVSYKQTPCHQKSKEPNTNFTKRKHLPVDRALKIEEQRVASWKLLSENSFQNILKWSTAYCRNQLIKIQCLKIIHWGRKTGKAWESCIKEPVARSGRFGHEKLDTERSKPRLYHITLLNKYYKSYVRRIWKY